MVHRKYANEKEFINACKVLLSMDHRNTHHKFALICFNNSTG